MDIDEKRPLSRVLESRMAELAVCAVEEDIVVSDASRLDLDTFIGTHARARRPSLFLLENGNYRLVWRNGDGEQLALQFLGGNKVQYVIFRTSIEMPGNLARAWGLDGIRGIDRVIDAFGVRRLMDA